MNASLRSALVALFALAGGSLAAEDGTGLAATYFAKVDFTGATVSRIDPTISFAGIGSPAQGIPAEWWSAAWVGSIEVPRTDRYTFTTNSDDGILLDIDGRTIIQNWTGHAPTLDRGQVELRAGRHTVAIRFYNSHNTATLQWFWETSTRPREMVPTNVLFPTIPPAIIGNGTGLTGSYYPNGSCSGSGYERLDPTIDFSWSGAAPLPNLRPDLFSCQWAGWIQPQYSDVYTFYADVDDGFALWLDGEPLIDSFDTNPRRQLTVQRRLVGGRKYEFQARHRQVGGNAKASLAWSSSLTPRQIVPTTQLYPLDPAADARVNVVSPLVSYVSPAWVEGEIGSGTTQVRARVNGADVPIRKLSRRSWFLSDADADATAPGVRLRHGANPLTLIAGDSSSDLEITWSSLDLAHVPYGLERLVLRPGDRLLATASGTAGSVLVVAAEPVDPQGTSLEARGVPGEALEIEFDRSGLYRLAASIDGVPVGGAVTIAVPRVDWDGPVADEIGFQRTKDIVLEDFGLGDAVSLGVNDPGLLEVVTVPGGQAGARRLLLRALASGSPALVARTQSPTGPVAAICPVDEFTLRTSAESFIDVVKKLPDGSLLTSAVLTMTPIVPRLDVSLSMYTGGATFIDGTTRLSIRSDDFTAWSAFGTYPYEIIRSPSPGSALCHSLQVSQRGVLVGGH